MIRLEDCRLIARIGKPHGHQGWVKLELLPAVEADLKIDEPVFLMIAGKPVPFFITALGGPGGDAFLRMEDVDTEESAKALRGLEVYAPKNKVKSHRHWQPGDLQGFLVYDKGQELGRVEAVLQSGLQDLLQLRYRDRELLIPLQEELIEEADLDAGKLYLDLPDGLLDL